MPLAKRSKTDLIVVHCSATPPTHNWGRAEIDRSHRERGFVMVGYHKIIKRDGTIEQGRRDDEIGAHAEGFNSRSVAVCMVGGVNAQGQAENNFTTAQFAALEAVLRNWRGQYRGAKIVGHRDLSPDTNRDGKVTSGEWTKQCPSFDVAAFLKHRGI